MTEALADPTLQAIPERPSSLSEIRRPIEQDLEAFRSYFREAMQSHVRILDLVTRYMLRRKGKQIRPILVLLSASACGGVSRTSYVAAALVELLHTATLVHDDVVDGAERRRGILSINAVWKNRVAVLFGDFLLSRGLLLALENRAYDLLHVVSNAVKRMSEGELLQMDKARRLDITEETYYRIISDKTASLFAACTACGAISATEDEEKVAQMAEFGEKLGLAFQIRDDLFDLGGEDVGKPVGNDLRERKITLPLIHALREGDSHERRKVLRIVKKKKKSGDDIRYVAAFVERQGGISYARDAMLRHAQEAREICRSLEDGEARNSLVQLIDFVVDRRR
jgi:octaprenyl-diphosphate synthase